MRKRKFSEKGDKKDVEIINVVLVILLILLLWSRSKLKKELMKSEDINRQLCAYEQPRQPTSSGTWEATTLYANNEIVEAGLEIWLSGRDWNEIQGKSFYRELIQYLDTLKTQNNTVSRHEQEY